LVIGSGGLSHDPPIPTLAGADGPVRERLVNGGVLSAEARAARQERVLADARLQQAGTSKRTQLNPAWDQEFLARIAAFDFAAIATMDDRGITRDGGCGGHEIRSWIAACAAAQAGGPCTSEVLYYHAIPAWIAGFGVMTVSPQKKEPSL
jgi:2,3-dihydroxyphenylpropionate 1,2-dioxygenase